MSEALVRSDPIPAGPFLGRDASLKAAPRLARYVLRARASAAVEKVLGAQIPKTIGGFANGVACLGPDEWLMFASDGRESPVDESGSVSVTDVSDRSVGIILEGARAAEVLATGCPLDLDHFAVGRATRTIYETVEIVIVREAMDRFHIEVWRSFAPWLWTALATAATE